MDDEPPTSILPIAPVEPSPPPPAKKSSKFISFLIVFLLLLITAVVVGGGVFYWQKTGSEKQTNELKASINKMTDEILTLKQEKTRLASEASQAVKAKSDAETKAKEIEQITCKGVWKNGICVKSTCVDSDVNEKPDDMYIKGNVTYTNEKGVETVVYDECSGSKQQVNEMWCYESPAGSGNYVQGKLVTNCPKGCLDGACIK